ncbi:MAG TPA: hypothetical protein VLL97_10310 [Acidobacteriota bacterium]|nr:hypothetical protein [Acidobacteriota bacterium]
MLREKKPYFFRRREVWKTTWRFRLGVIMLLAVILAPTHPHWLASIGRSLVHSEEPLRSDLIIVENYDPDYLVFETAARLLRNGLSDQILIPVTIFRDPDKPNAVSQGIVEVMTRIAGIDKADLLPVSHEEPVTLTVVRQVAEAVEKRNVRSVIVVSPLFRSRRTFEVYRTILVPRGITVICVASGGPRTPENWWKTTHGIQNIVLEFIKLQYYRLFIL